MAWAPVYSPWSEVGSYLNLESDENKPYLEDEAEAAARAIDFATGRQFGLVDAAETRTYVAQWNRSDRLWELEIDDLMTTEDLVVTVEGQAVASSEYELWPLNRPQKGKPWEYLRLEDATDAAIGSGPYTVDVTAWWGWSSGSGPPTVATPRAIKSVQRTLASRWFTRRHSPLGVQGSPDVGVELRLDGPDKDIAQRVRPFWRLSKARGFA